MMCSGSQMTVLLIFFAPTLLWLSSAQDCDPVQRTSISHYSIFPNSLFGGVPLADGDTNQGCVVGGGAYECLGNRKPLVDGDLGPENSTYTSGIIHAWSSSQTDRVIVTYFSRSGIPITIRRVKLYFYNIPALHVGLPNIEFFPGESGGIAVPYYLLGNSDFSQEDNGRRSVTLSLTNTQFTRNYRLEFTFGGTSVDFLILSEAFLCATPAEVIRPTEPPSILPLSPIVRRADDVSSNLTLTCTVSGDGTFRWEWRYPSGSPPNVTETSDASRTSTAVFTRLTGPGSATGEVTYRCTAYYNPSVPNVESGSQDITVQLKSDVRMIPSSGTVVASLSENRTLACEIFGYFPRTLPTITWQFQSDDIDFTSGLYSMSTRPGSAYIQNGGESAIPSVISELTISLQNSSMFGVYVCQEPRFKIFEVREAPGGVTLPAMTMPPDESTTGNGSTASTTEPFPPPPPESPINTTIIASAAAAGAVVILAILAAIVAILVVLILRGRSTKNRFKLTTTRRKDSLDYTGEEAFYQELSKPAPPPLPDHFPELNQDIEAYAVVGTALAMNGGVRDTRGATTAGYQNISSSSAGNMEMRDMKNRNLSPPVVRLSMDKETSPELPFLEKNPLYASTDNVVEDERITPRQRRHLGSVPSLDVLTDSPTGSQLNIYADPAHVVMTPPLPDRLATPDLLLGDDEPIYSESHIQPSAFKSREPSPAPEKAKEEEEQEKREDQSLPCFSIYANPQPLLRSEAPKEVTLHNVRELRSLGVGQFGQVLLAETVNLSRKDLGLSRTEESRDVTVLVAVKRLKASAEAHVKEAFEKEIKFMSRLRHKNVVRLMGICPTGDMFIIMEYMENGDLNQFLHKHKLVSAEATPKRRGLTARQLMDMCAQIACGMKYLAGFKFIHRDLATRNCLVGENLQIKIADFGMSRSLYSLDYYRISGRAMLPIRWMANECFYGKFSEKTDVWAYGVTMWEVFTFSREQPYQNMSDQEVIDDAIKGPNRLLPSRPEACPEVVYEVMRRCWVDDPVTRISFRQTHTALKAILDSEEFK